MYNTLKRYLQQIKYILHSNLHGLLCLERAEELPAILFSETIVGIHSMNELSLQKCNFSRVIEYLRGDTSAPSPSNLVV